MNNNSKQKTCFKGHGCINHIVFALHFSVMCIERSYSHHCLGFSSFCFKCNDVEMDLCGVVERSREA